MVYSAALHGLLTVLGGIAGLTAGVALACLPPHRHTPPR